MASWDPVWESVFRENEWGKYPGEELIRFVARNFYKAADRSAVRLLEVGCGPGPNVWFMAREGFTVHGIEGSETAVARARARLDRECPGWKGELKVGDIGSLPWPDGTFDAVIDNEAISCNSLEDSRRIYREMARVARPGGKLYSRTLARGMWGDGTGKSVGHNAWIVAEGPLLNRGYVRFTGLEEIPDLVQGFRVTGVERLSWTLDDRKHEVIEWIILGEKAAAAS